MSFLYAWDLQTTSLGTINVFASGSTSLSQPPGYGGGTGGCLIQSDSKTSANTNTITNALKAKATATGTTGTTFVIVGADWSAVTHVRGYQANTNTSRMSAAQGVVSSAVFAAGDTTITVTSTGTLADGDSVFDCTPIVVVGGTGDWTASNGKAVIGSNAMGTANGLEVIGYGSISGGTTLTGITRGQYDTTTSGLGHTCVAHDAGATIEADTTGTTAIKTLARPAIVVTGNWGAAGAGACLRTHGLINGNHSEWRTPHFRFLPGLWPNPPTIYAAFDIFIPTGFYYSTAASKSATNFVRFNGTGATSGDGGQNNDEQLQSTSSSATLNVSMGFVTTDTQPSGNIDNATNATPIVVTTSAAHGLSNGQLVTIAGVSGNTAANGSWTIANVTATTFELVGSVGNGVYGAASDSWATYYLYNGAANSTLIRIRTYYRVMWAYSPGAGAVGATVRTPGSMFLYRENLGTTNPGATFQTAWNAATADSTWKALSLDGTDIHTVNELRLRSRVTTNVESSRYEYRNLAISDDPQRAWDYRGEISYVFSPPPSLSGTSKKLLLMGNG